MNQIAERTELVRKLKKEIVSHPMAARFSEDRGCYLVFYPEGFFPDGARVSKGMGKAKALARMLEVMERHWKEAQL